MLSKLKNKDPVVLKEEDDGWRITVMHEGIEVSFVRTSKSGALSEGLAVLRVLYEILPTDTL